MRGEVYTYMCGSGSGAAVVAIAFDGWPSDELMSSYCGSRPDFERMDEGYIGITVRRERGGGGRRWRGTRRRHATHDDNQHNQSTQPNKFGISDSISAFRVRFNQASVNQAVSTRRGSRKRAGARGARHGRHGREHGRRLTSTLPDLARAVPASGSCKEKFRFEW